MRFSRFLGRLSPEARASSSCRGLDTSGLSGALERVVGSEVDLVGGACRLCSYRGLRLWQPRARWSTALHLFEHAFPLQVDQSLVDAEAETCQYLVHCPANGFATADNPETPDGLRTGSILPAE